MMTMVVLLQLQLGLLQRKRKFKYFNYDCRHHHHNHVTAEETSKEEQVTSEITTKTGIISPVALEVMTTTTEGKNDENLINFKLLSCCKLYNLFED